MDKEEMETRIERLEYCLGTLISWLSMELGEHNAIKLLNLLEVGEEGDTKEKPRLGRE